MSFLHDAKKVIQHAWQHKEVFSSDNVADKRIAICENCQHYTIDKRCKFCSCYMPIKARFIATSCPIKLW